MGLADYLRLGGRKVLGLDIGTSSVKIAQVKKTNGQYCVGKCAKVDIASWDCENEDEFRKNTIDAVRLCVDIVEARTSYAVCAVNGADVTVRSFNFPEMAEEQIAWAVLQEAEQVSPLDIQFSVVDYELVSGPNDGQGISGLLVAASIELVREKRQKATDAGLQNVVMDVNSLALLNCFTEFGADCRDRTTAVLDIGNRTTNLLILSEEALPFVRSISHGGAEAVKFISKELEMSVKMVDEVLRQRIRNISETESFKHCFRRGCETLVREVAETFRYYRTHENDCRIAKVYICGGFAGAAGFEELLNERFPGQIELWNPLQNASFQSRVGDVEEIIREGPSMAVALGLAMRSI